MVVGIGLMLVILAMAWSGQFRPSYYTPVEVSGLYWHFVDIVWIFLFPLLYLLGYHYGTRTEASMSATHVIVPVRIYVAIFVSLLVLTA